MKTTLSFLLLMSSCFAISMDSTLETRMMAFAQSFRAQGINPGTWKLICAKKKLPVFQNATMVIVGGHYVSASVCHADPKACEVQANITQNQTQAPAYKRTIAECSAAREKYWAQYCYAMDSGTDKIDCGYIAQFDPAEMNSILDNMANESNTNQGICLRGG